MSEIWDIIVIKINNSPAPIKRDFWWDFSCSISECINPEEYLIQYRYITGRRGRATTRRMIYCRDHAEKFCKKHQIDIEAVSELEWQPNLRYIKIDSEGIKL